METERITYHVETADRLHIVEDRDQARAINQAHPGSSWWVDVVKLAASVVVTAGAALVLTQPPAAAAQPQEDDPGWSCVDSANHVCGPLSDDYGHTPGCYDDGGVMVAAWPCSVVVNPDGSSDIYTPDARG